MKNSNSRVLAARWNDRLGATGCTSWQRSADPSATTRKIGTVHWYVTHFDIVVDGVWG
jgi:hypothetical protein